MKFKTTLLQAGKTATGIVVPEEIVTALGAGKRPPVRVTINGYTYRNTIAVMGGDFMVGVSAEHRAGAGIAGGDEIEVELVLDTAPREVSIPVALAELLDKNPEAKAAYEKLSYSNKLRHSLAIGGAKTHETLQRRLDKVLTELGKT